MRRRSPAARGRSSRALGRLGIAPHDQRVLAVVGVVAAPHAARLEPGFLVEADRDVVRHADLERVPAPAFAGGCDEQLLEQPGGDVLTAASLGGRGGSYPTLAAATGVCQGPGHPRLPRGARARWTRGWGGAGCAG